MTAGTPGDEGAHPTRGRVGGREQHVVDRTSDRTATLNQLLLAAVVFVLGVVVAFDPFPGDTTPFFLGVVSIVVVTGATMAVPWNRLPDGWVAVVPALDVVAITLMQLSAPGTVLGLLWIFPAMWLAGGFGLLGLLGVMVAIVTIVSVLAALSAVEAAFHTLLLLLVLLAVAATSHLNARRSDAQRTLLAKQAQLLRTVLARVRRQEQAVTEVLDAVDFGVVRIGADGRTAVTNDAHGRLQQGLGPGADEVSVFRDDGTTPLPPEELPLERARRGEAFDDQVVWFGVGSGPRRALTITARRLTEPSGDDAGVVVVSRDVTAELNALRARDDLVASVSHELRTPLTSILGYLDLAIEDPDTPEAVRANLDIAERNAERLLRIVADILAASSSSATKVEASLTPRLLDAREIVRAAAADAAQGAATRAIRIDATGLEPAPIWADPLRLRQVVDNLISNAVAYNKDAGTVFVGTTTDGSSSWIVVRDTGIGISDAERSRLFQRYYKAGAVRRTGTGLGLAITRDIVRAHGGEIALHSSPGVGSTFVVRLPAGRPEGTAS